MKLVCPFLKRGVHFLCEMVIHIWRSRSRFEPFIHKFFLTQVKGPVQRVVAAAFSTIQIISDIGLRVNNMIPLTSEENYAI